MPSSAWAGWICFESEMEVEAAKGVLYRRLMLRAVQLSSEVYSSCGGEGLQFNVPYRRRLLNFQYPDRVKPLKILTSLWFRLLVRLTLCSFHLYQTFNQPLASPGGRGSVSSLQSLDCTYNQQLPICHIVAECSIL
jgi:hypothetical protein